VHTAACMQGAASDFSLSAHSLYLPSSPLPSGCAPPPGGGLAFEEKSELDNICSAACVSSLAKMHDVWREAGWRACQLRAALINRMLHPCMNHAHTLTPQRLNHCREGGKIQMRRRCLRIHPEPTHALVCHGSDSPREAAPSRPTPALSSEMEGSSGTDFLAREWKLNRCNKKECPVRFRVSGVSSTFGHLEIPGNRTNPSEMSSVQPVRPVRSEMSATPRNGPDARTG